MALDQKSILVLVDNSPSQREASAEKVAALKAAGHRIYPVETTEEFKDAIAKGKYDLVVVHTSATGGGFMSEPMAGTTAADRAREHGHSGPIIAVVDDDRYDTFYRENGSPTLYADQFTNKIKLSEATPRALVKLIEKDAAKFDRGGTLDKRSVLVLVDNALHPGSTSGTFGSVDQEIAALRATGHRIDPVGTLERFKEALTRNNYDIVLVHTDAQHGLYKSSERAGEAASDFAREQGYTGPIIAVVSGGMEDRYAKAPNGRVVNAEGVPVSQGENFTRTILLTDATPKALAALLKEEADALDPSDRTKAVEGAGRRT